MKYRIGFEDPQMAAATLHGLAIALQRSLFAPDAPQHTRWSVTYTNNPDGVEILAAYDSRSVVVFQNGEVVFSSGRQGQLQNFQAGAWMHVADSLYCHAVEVGLLVPLPPRRRSLTQAELELYCPDFANCPWIEAIEAELEPWDITA